MKPASLSAPLATRRAFLGRAAALAACAVLPRIGRAATAAPGRPNSVFDGVRVGCISYSYRREIVTAEDTLKALLTDGLSEVELMGAPIQDYAGFTVSGGGKGGKGGIL